MVGTWMGDLLSRVELDAVVKNNVKISGVEKLGLQFLFYFIKPYCAPSILNSVYVERLPGKN